MEATKRTTRNSAKSILLFRGERITYEEYKKAIEVKWLAGKNNPIRTVGLADEHFYATILFNLVDSPTLALAYLHEEYQKETNEHIRPRSMLYCLREIVFKTVGGIDYTMSTPDMNAGTDGLSISGSSGSTHKPMATRDSGEKLTTAQAFSAPFPVFYVTCWLSG